MEETVFHIGMHKTGSTSIQRSLAGFEDERTLYLASPLGRINHSAFLLALIGTMGSDRPAGPALPGGQSGGARARRLLDPANHERAARSLRNALKSAGSRRLVLSAEGAMALSREELGDLRNRLTRGGRPIAVYGYVRAPVAYATSVFQQRQKNMRSSELDLPSLFCSYRRQFGKFDQVFGAARVALRKFDPPRLLQRCVVRDFCDWTRIGYAGPAVRSNEAHNDQLVRLQYLYHAMARRGVVPPGSTALLWERLAGIEGARLRFAPSVLRPVVETLRPDIRWMEDRLGASLDEELGEDEEGDIRDESDLLRLRPATLERLRELAAPVAPGPLPTDTPEAVARLLAMLRHAAEAEAARATKPEPAAR